ncbi:MAG: methyltransferase domain-containing protein [Planctomycetes bacterium]|nr:methyltransferase domain-containing protein [Planctomycetota bacterium]
MSDSDRQRWDAKYADKASTTVLPPDDWLSRHATPLAVGVALDLACGLGHNAIWLSQHGWKVDAVDISPIGLALAEQAAERANVQTISWIAADLDRYEPPTNHYDLVTVFRFLDRHRLPHLIERSLRTGGILIYETFSQGQLSRADNHLISAQFTLGPDELPTLFPGLEILFHDETELPDRSVARIVGRKP